MAGSEETGGQAMKLHHGSSSDATGQVVVDTTPPVKRLLAERVAGGSLVEDHRSEILNLPRQSKRIR